MKNLTTEQPQDELTGAAATTALQEAFTVTFGREPRITFSVAGLSTHRVGDRVRVLVTFTDGSTAALSIRATRVKALRDQLSTVVDA